MNRGLAAAGVVAVVLGIAVFVEPTLFGNVSLPALLVGVFGVLALVQGVYFAYGRLGSDGPPALPLPERRHVASVPGDEFDDLLWRATSGDVAYNARDRTAVRERLERVAVAVLARTDGIGAETARERLEDGTWTDDLRAAAFFSTRVAIELSLAARLRAAIASNVAFRNRARDAIDELAARLEAR